MVYYDPNDSTDWEHVTEEAISYFPISTDYLVQCVLDCWDKIMHVTIFDSLKLYNLKPKPQMLGFFLHALIGFKIAHDDPTKWREEKNASDKDVVNIENDEFSFEIKTSSDSKHIFGNRSFAQQGDSKNKKSKSGYYLAVNFEKFEDKIYDENNLPQIQMIRFGWIDHEDWMGQQSATGQQARLSRDVETKKLKTIYPK